VVKMVEEELKKRIYICEKCKVEMKLVSVRDDGMGYYECRICGATLGEETEEWFKKQKEANEKLWRKEELKKKIADLIYNAKWHFDIHNWEGIVEGYWMDNEDEVIEEIIKLVKEE